MQPLRGLLLLVAGAAAELRVPSAPTDALLAIVGGDSVQTSWAPPLSDGGAAVQSYQVEWDTNPGVAEVQTVTTSTYLGANELQTIRTFGKDVDEVQLVQTLARAHREEQWVTATAPAGSTLAGTFALALDTRPTGGTLQYTGAIPASAAACCGRTSVLGMVEALQNVGNGMVSKVKREDVSIDGRAGFQWQIQFNETLADLPQLQVLDASGLTLGSTVVVQTETEGNAISGTFRLTFSGDTTALIVADASAGEVEDALELLDTITDVTVQRADATPFGGFSWFVTFVHRDQGGDQPLLAPVYDGTLKGTSGDPWVVTSEVRAGNTLSGNFNVSFAGVDGVHPGSTVIQNGATAEEVVEALTLLPGVPSGTVAVSRSGPDPENGYVWTVSFLDDAARTWEKQQGDDFNFEVASTANLIGVDARARIDVLRAGTVKEVQMLNITRGGYNDTKNDYFYLNFRGATTGQIFAASDYKTGACGDASYEVQRISSRTVDTTSAGGDAAISPRTTFRLSYGRETTGYIYAANDGDCAVAGAKIKAELETLEAFYDVDVASSAALGSHECDWDVTFSSTAGNVDQPSISVSRDAQGAEDGPADTAQAGDDTLSVSTTTEGRTDIVQSELEALSTIGRVTVSVEEAGGGSDEWKQGEGNEKRRTGTCLYRVTFDTSAGDLPMISVCGEPSCGVNFNSNVDGQGVQNFVRGSFLKPGMNNMNSTVNVTLVQKSTSVAISGDLALEFRGQRTGYLPYTSSAYDVEAALEALSTIGSVAVNRSAPDENGGATWSITFLTELGDVPMLVADDLDMSGTAVSATTFLRKQGVFPPFDSLDPLNGLPLGSAAITDLADLDLTISKLETRVPYYVRVSAVNALGQGPWAMTTPPYVAPTPFRPGAPVNVSLSVLDATSLRLALEEPTRDGGDALDSYRVEWAGEPFVDEVQAVRLSMNATTEVQVVRTELPAWRNFSEVQLIHLKLDDAFDGTNPSDATGSRLETQLIECDASGGSFTLSFDGLTTRSIAYNANPSVMEAALEELTNINDVTVAFTGVNGGATTACIDGGDGRTVIEDGHSPHVGYEAAINVTFNSVSDYVGPVPALVAHVNNLEGMRRVDVYRNREGVAGLGGTYKLKFRGEATQAISFQATDKEVEAALIALDTIQALESIGVTGVNVSDWSSDMVVPYSSNERLYAVEFRGSGVGGNVEAMTVGEDKLTGSGASLALYTDGAETAANVRHCVYCASRSGVELGGTFTLTLRRHTTEPIEYNAAASTMKARLEQLPNIGLVDVTRSAPGPRREYAWTISFASNPGYWPAHARDVALLVPDDTTLLPLGANFSRGGVNDGTQRGTTLDRFLNNPPLYPKATVVVSERVKGSQPLQGTFQLTFCNDTRAGLYRAPKAPYPGRFWSPTECDYSGSIPHDASPAAFEHALEAMEHVGDVEVSRASNHDGYTWFVTFGGCKTNRWGDDVCNGGDVATLDWAQPNSTLTGGDCASDYRDDRGAGDCSGLNVSVTEVTRGSGPGTCAEGELGECVATATDLSGGAPYAYDLLGLTTGERYYARARWHNDLGFGVYELSQPEFETPSWNAPGAPPPVRLINSSSVSLAVAWDHPTEDGGAGVVGYELWMDEWAGGRPRMVFDGTDQVDVTRFVVRTRTSVGLESGKQYRFTVRAVNYCNARDADLICRGAYSNPSVFTVRNPRAPMAPLAPVQVSMSA